MRTPARRAPQIAQVATFGAVSVATTILDFGLFNLFVFLDVMSLIAANTVSYGAGIVLSYVLNKHLTFRGGGERRRREIALFVMLNIGSLWLNNAAVAVAAGLAGTSPLFLNAAKLAAGVVTWVLKFLAFRRWVYPLRPTDDEVLDSGESSSAPPGTLST